LRSPVVDHGASQFDAFPQGFDLFADQEGRGRIEQNDVPVGAGFTAEQAA
jgi:hypothetical protein